LTDQVAYLRALLDAYEISGEIRLLARARALVEAIARIFTDPNGALKDHADGDAIGLLGTPLQSLPENASVADSLLRLGVITAEPHYAQAGARILQAFRARYAGYRTFAAPYGAAAARLLYAGASVTIVGEGESTAAFRETARRLPDPFLVIATLPPDDPLVEQRALRAIRGTSVAYLCRGTVCSAPVTDPAELRTVFDYTGR
jgi:uncharacterized protein YyaL (SSP411 family)